MLYWFFDGNEPIVIIFNWLLCIINNYVTDVIVTWSDVIDQL